MKLAEKPRLELLYKVDNLIIPFVKGQTAALMDFLASLDGLDLSKDYEVKIELVKKKRSGNANSMYHSIAKKCAFAKGIPFEEYHNRNLAEIGIAWKDKDNNRTWVLRKDDDSWLKEIQEHYCPTEKTELRNGVVYRWFYLLKPSRFFDTKEMSILIDAVVQDAHSLGVETPTEEEQRRAKETWNAGNP